MLNTRDREFLLLANRQWLVAAGVFFLSVLAAVVAGRLILRELGPLAIGACVLAAFCGIIVARWQRGVYGLLFYLPFSGIVTLALYPWEGPAIFNPVLSKDWLFVFPAYAGFLGALVLRRVRLPRLPRLPTVFVLALSILVITQMANPGVANLLMGLIGLKVWLFYIPLYVLSFVLIASRRDLVFLMRLLVVLAIIPCAIGIAEFLLVRFFGYEVVMKAIYGSVAARATQGFASFQVGGGLIARIPSTFSFVTQYLGYTFAMLVPCYVMLRGDPSAGWRRFGKWMLGFVALASLLTGARAAFVFVPLLLTLMYGLDRGFSGLLRAGGLGLGVLFGAIAITRVTAVGLFEHISGLFVLYAQETAYGGLVQALISAPLGMGTGTNTGPARYAFSDPGSFVAIENYYAKAAYELGIPGLLLVCGLFASFIWLGLRSRRRLRDTALRACAAALLAFFVTIALNSFKGWLLDLDPINVCFWVFAGVLMKLPYLQFSQQHQTRRAVEAQR